MSKKVKSRSRTSGYKTVDRSKKTERIESEINNFKNVSRNYMDEIHSLKLQQKYGCSIQALFDRVKENQLKFDEFLKRKKELEYEIEINSDKISALENTVKYSESDLLDLIEKENLKSEELINKIKANHKTYKLKLITEQEFILKNKELAEKINLLRQNALLNINSSRASPIMKPNSASLHNLREQYETLKKEFIFQTLRNKNQINYCKKELNDLSVNLHFVNQVFSYTNLFLL